MTKLKYILFLLAIALLPQLSRAERVKIGELHYELNDQEGTAEITFQKKQTVENYEGFESIIIPNTIECNSRSYKVSSIGDNAFYGCYSLTKIEIPNSVISIGDNAFSYCSSLTSIEIPNSVKSIGERAFEGCSSLSSIKIPSSVTSIGAYTFSGCSSLTSITIPNSVTSIERNAFSRCSSLLNIAIPNSVTSLGVYALSGCSSLTSIVIPNSVTLIEERVFEGCSSLTSLGIPPSITSIGEYAFYDCENLKQVNISDLQAWCKIIFKDTYSNPLNYAHHLYLNGQEIVNLIIPNSVTSIRNRTFQGCSSLTSISIPNSVTSIGDHAFSGCGSLTSIVIPNSVTSIGEWAFSSCSSLTSIEIPNSVTSIGEYAFYDCKNLKRVNISDLQAWCKIIFKGHYSNPLVKAHHLYLNGQEIVNLIIPNSVTSIGNEAFSGCSSLISIEIPNSVTSIGEGAFLGCSSLKNISIPNSVTSVRKYAFSGCSSLSSINVDTNNKIYCSVDGILYSKGKTALFRCPQEKTGKVVIPNSVTSIRENAFSYCSSLTSIEIPNSVKSIGDGAFYGCSSLNSIEIPNSVTSIGWNSFSKCSSLKQIIAPQNLVAELKQNYKNINIITDENYYASIDKDKAKPDKSNSVKSSTSKVTTEDGKRIAALGGDVKTEITEGNSSRESAGANPVARGVLSGSGNGKRRMESCNTKTVSVGQKVVIKVNVVVADNGTVKSANATGGGGNPELRNQCVQWALKSRWTPQAGAGDVPGCITFTIIPRTSIEVNQNQNLAKNNNKTNPETKDETKNDNSKSTNKSGLQEVKDKMLSWDEFYKKNRKAKLTYENVSQIEAYINKEIEKWQVKDEFETTNEWKARVNETTRQQKVRELSAPLIEQHNREVAQINEEQKRLAQEYEKYKQDLIDGYYRTLIGQATNSFSTNDFSLNPYDADNGTFLIRSSKYGDILLPVPGRDEARSFKENWESIKKSIKPEFVPNGEDVALTKLIFTNNGKQYVYDSHTEANYAVTDVKYNFKPVELADISLDDINTNLPALTNADVSSQIISKTSNEAISPQKVQPSKNTVVASDRSDVDYAIPTGIGDANSTTYAVIIANENYKTLSKVPYAANDGEIMSKYLTTAVGLPQSHVKVYKNATVGSMAEAVSYMEDLGKAYGDKLNLIFYYAGHGVPDEKTKTALLLPVDGNPSISKTCYSVDELVKNLGNLKANNVIVMLDACFSGATRNDDMLVAARGVKLRSNDIIPIGNMVFFSATQGDKTAYPYEKEGHGLFTYFLLKKLQENKGNVTLGELADYVIEKVKQKSMETNGKLQTPTVTVSPNLQSSWREIPLK